MKFTKLKSLHLENKKLNRSIFTSQVIRYSMWQKLVWKCYSEFFIDVIRLEIGKLFKWIQMIVQLRLQCRFFLVNFAKILKTPYLQDTSEQLHLDFFVHLTVFATQWTKGNQVFSIFEHVMNMMNDAFGKRYLPKQTN